jgi:hypothetical protein
MHHSVDLVKPSLFQKAMPYAQSIIYLKALVKRFNLNMYNVSQKHFFFKPNGVRITEAIVVSKFKGLDAAIPCFMRSVESILIGTIESN